MDVSLRVEAAIGQVGEWIVPEGEAANSFRGSVQPRFGGEEELSGPPGYGAARRFRLFTGCSVPAMAVKSGDVLRCGEGRYQVVRIETCRVAGKAVCRRA